MTATTDKIRVLSGVRPTARMHPGNFFGAVRLFEEHQSQGNECFFFVADGHALTVLPKAVQTLRAELSQHTVDLVLDFLAAGLDPAKSSIYLQSQIPEIFELAMLLSMFMNIGQLLRIPTFKDKVRAEVAKGAIRTTDDDPDGEGAASVGLVMYPVLMAADILGPRGTLIPVGEDQLPNIELAQALVKRANRYLGTDYFPEISPTDDPVKLIGVDGKKMSKSEGNGFGLTEDMGGILAKYRKAPTDPQKTAESGYRGDPYNRCPVIYPTRELVTPGETSTREVAKACLAGSLRCFECKQGLSTDLEAALAPFRAARAELDGKPNKREIAIEALMSGTSRVRAITAETVRGFKELLGLAVPKA